MAEKEIIETEIIEQLTSSDIPVRTIEIAKNAFGETGTSKNVNPILYRLQKEGKLVKVSNSDGSNPRWWLKSKGSPPKTKDSSVDMSAFVRDPNVSVEDSVIKILSLTDEPVPTLQISKGIHGKGATTKMINPTLYSMMKEKKIEKVSNPDGTQPKWKLSQKE